jgi:hypothetical protein
MEQELQLGSKITDGAAHNAEYDSGGYSRNWLESKNPENWSL